jgi:hypothetical protein
VKLGEPDFRPRPEKDASRIYDYSDDRVRNPEILDGVKYGSDSYFGLFPTL